MELLDLSKAAHHDTITLPGGAIRDVINNTDLGAYEFGLLNALQAEAADARRGRPNHQGDTREGEAAASRARRAREAARADDHSSRAQKALAREPRADHPRLDRPQLQ
jgi:hypothetical protein